MNSPAASTGRFEPGVLLAVVAAPLFVLLVAQGAGNWTSGGAGLARLESCLAVMLLIASAVVQHASRRVVALDRVTLALLLVGCTVAAAFGNRPGAVAGTLPEALAIAALITTVFALLAGRCAGRWAAVLTASGIAFAFVTAASWQVAGMPFVARLIVG